MKKRKSLLGRLLIFAFSIIAFGGSIYAFNYNFVYDSINLVTNKTTVIEYGNPNVDLKKMVNKVDGEIVSVKNQVKTDVVGKQNVVFVVAKGNVSKEIPIEVEVKDTILPTINLYSDTITIKQGDKVDLLSNIESVVDSVDGEIPYILDASLKNNNYYTISGEVNCNVVGTYVISVSAVDKNNNVAVKDFNVVVEENEITRRVVNDAYSLLGKPYVLGARGPYAFDCSGLVQFLYARVGISVGRGCNNQFYDGIAVSYEEILPGDIIIWGYGEGQATHSSIYVGNGKMIHAANPSQGVIISDVMAWDRGTDVTIIGVRRIK